MWEGYLKDEFVRNCKEKGISITQVHTSGHSTIEDLTTFATAINPKILIPIHTFEKDRYSSLFNNVKVLNDGKEFEIV